MKLRIDCDCGEYLNIEFKPWVTGKPLFDKDYTKTGTVEFYEDMGTFVIHCEKCGKYLGF